MDFELCHEAIQMGADRVRGQVQPLRDLFPVGAVDEVDLDLPLARRERREQVITVAATVQALDEQAQDRA